MALQKLTYTDGVTVIPASNLNAIQDAIIELENQQTSGVSDDLKTALLQLAQKVAYIDDNGQDYYTALYNALYPPAGLVSISAVYTQSGTVYDTDSLDSLKADLVVTAHYSDSSTQTVPSADYTLSGSLTVGTSTIIVSYGGKTDTFTVTVTHYTIPMLYNWDFTQSLTDTEQNVTVTSLSGYAPTRDSSGLSFTAARQQISVPVSIDMSGKTLEVDVASFEFAGNTGYHIRFVMLNSDPTNSIGLGVLVYQSGTAWKAYGSLAATGTSADWSDAWSSGLTGNSDEIRNAFSGKTVKIVFNEDGHTMSLYRDDVLDGTLTSRYFGNPNMRYISIGGLQTGAQNAGNQFFNAVITGMRIYENT